MTTRPETQKVLLKQLELPSKPEIIHDVEMVIDEIRTELDFKEDVYGNVMVAVTEAVNNGIIHGNKGDESKKIFLEFEMVNQYCLKVRVKDEGKGFDPDSLADPTAPENLINAGGRGVFLMQHLSDKLSYDDEGRVAEMMFNI